MTSLALTGITSRCSKVPCSRSRITAAPLRIMASMVTLLTICMTDMNQADSILGLYFARTRSSTGSVAVPAARPVNFNSSALTMLEI